MLESGFFSRTILQYFRKNLVIKSSVVPILHIAVAFKNIRISSTKSLPYNNNPTYIFSSQNTLIRTIFSLHLPPMQMRKKKDNVTKYFLCDKCDIHLLISLNPLNICLQMEYHLWTITYTYRYTSSVGHTAKSLVRL